MVRCAAMPSETDPDTERKARRAQAILAVVMVVFIALPFVLWWLRGR